MAAEREIITLAQVPADFHVYVRPVVVLATDDPGVVLWPCPRCWDENGKIGMYAHVAGGVCFKCSGFGGEAMPRAEAEAKAARALKGRIRYAEKKEAERQANLAARAATQQALIAEHPALAVLLDEAASGTERPAEPGEEADGYGWDHETDREYPVVRVEPLGSAIHAMASDFRYRPERFNAKRAAAAAAAIERAQARVAAHEAKLAAVADVQIPTGRVKITGKVIAVWEKEATFGYRTTSTLKMRVETAQGWVGIGTIPNGFWGTGGFDGDYRGLRGAQVEFTATVEPAAEQREGELPVGWLNRPTKAQVLALAVQA